VRFGFSLKLALDLRFGFELVRFAQLRGLHRAKIGVRARACRGFGGAVGFDALLGLLRERGFALFALGRGVPGTVLGGDARVRRRFGFPLGLLALGGLCRRVRFGGSALFGGGLRALLGFEPRLCELRLLRVGFGAPLGRDLQLELGGFARFRGVRRLRFGGDTLGCGAFRLLLHLRALRGSGGSGSVRFGSLERRALGALLGFDTRLSEAVRFGLGGAALLRLRFRIELGRLARLRLRESVRFRLGARARRRFGEPIGFDARLSVALERRFGLRTLVGRNERALLIGFTRACSGFGLTFGFAARFGFFAGARLGFGAALRFGRERGLGLRALRGMLGKLALRFGPCALGRRGVRFCTLAFAQSRFGARFRLGALSRRLLGGAIGFGTRGGFLRGARLGERTFVRRRFGFALGGRERFGDLARFAFRFEARVGLRLRFALDDFACGRGVARPHLRLRALERSIFCRTIGFDARRGLRLELGLGALARARRLGGFLLGGRARLGGADGARFRRGFGARHRFGVALGLDARGRLTLELGFRRAARGFGFERVLLRRRTRFRRLRGARFGGGARLRDRFGCAVGFAARGRLLLGFGFAGESGVRRLDGALVGGGAGLSGGLRFGFGLLARLRFFDRTQVGRDAALRAQLGLALHFGPLERKTRRAAFGFSAGLRLLRARAFGGAAGARRSECSPLAFGSESCAYRFFGCVVSRFGGLQGAVDRFVFGTRIRRRPFGRSRYAALPLLLTPHELRAADVTEQLAQSFLRAARFSVVRPGSIS
jgi:hypothetical protein